MPNFDGALMGMIAVFSIQNIFFIMIGLSWGILAGAIPGFTSPMAIVLLMPLSYALEPLSAIVLLASCYAGSLFGGSITAILLNAPGTPAAVCTAFDGYEMNKKGKSSEALGFALGSSSIGGLISYILFIILMGPISVFALKFGSPEMFMLAVLGLSVISGLEPDHLLKGILAVLVGLLLGTIGTASTGDMRGTFFLPDLMDGIPFIPALVGLFAFSELFLLVQRDHVYEESIDFSKNNFSFKKVLVGIKGVFNYPKTLLFSTLLGTFIGAVPAAGGSIASFIAYNQSKQFSANPDSFGKGNPQGIVASESSNNASSGGALITTLAVGIPGSAPCAILLAALLLHGIMPGPRLFLDQMPLVFGLFGGLIVASIAMLILGVFFSSGFARAMMIPNSILVPTVAILCVVGTFSIRNSIFDVGLMVLFALLGIIMNRCDYPPIAIVLGIILGPI
ncbi:MAG: C4-dicarboxylate ABC transporter permease, partial [Bacteroidales bacterium]|nr:C4-dicarboxylate ABC transporter permease [Bacteroidales bacterium]